MANALRHLARRALLGGLGLGAILSEVVVVDREAEVAGVLVLVASCTGFGPRRLVHEGHVHWRRHRVVLPRLVGEETSSSCGRLVRVQARDGGVGHLGVRSCRGHVPLIARVGGSLAEGVELTAPRQIVRHVARIRGLRPEVVEALRELLVLVELLGEWCVPDGHRASWEREPSCRNELAAATRWHRTRWYHWQTQLEAAVLLGKLQSRSTRQILVLLMMV